MAQPTKSPVGTIHFRSQSTEESLPSPTTTKPSPALGSSPATTSTSHQLKASRAEPGPLRSSSLMRLEIDSDAAWSSRSATEETHSSETTPMTRPLPSLPKDRSHRSLQALRSFPPLQLQAPSAHQVLQVPQVLQVLRAHWALQE